ncbi:MAG: molecular chaperone DnaJ [Pseudomonadales bacterium]
MSRILLVALAIFAVIMWFQIRTVKNPRKRKELTRKVVLWSTVGILVLLAASGRMHWVGAALAALLPLIRPLLFFALQNIPLLASMYKRYASGSSAKATSSVESDYLTMQLNHETGELNGDIVQGPNEGAQLSELNQAQLQELLKYYGLHDYDSARLLESYMEQRFEQDFESAEQSEKNSQVQTDGMNQDEALAILGLDESADKADIIAAHRVLMQKLHPDRGGNDYLASKLNEARDLLLK